MPFVIKFAHLANNKVIIITFQENRGQTLKIETTVLVLGMFGTNIDHVVFSITALGTMLDLVNCVDQVKVSKLKVRYCIHMIL